MSIPPEVLFHRFFQTLGPEDRVIYRGKADLIDTLQPRCHAPVDLLVQLQAAYNDALSKAKQVEAHAEHGILFFDWVDSEEPNALAFSYEGYAFVGMTIGLVNLSWELCTRLSESDGVREALGLNRALRSSSLHAALSREQLLFILSHEWAHHVQGTVPGASRVFADEVLGRDKGGLRSQAYEAAADGYAAYHGLEALLNSDARALAIALLEITEYSPEQQDEILLALFVCAVAGFFFAHEPRTLTQKNVRVFSHPPQIARMGSFLNWVLLWCRDFRPQLTWLTPERFGRIFEAVAGAAWGLNGARDWQHQVEFILTPAGRNYDLELQAVMNEHVRGSWH